MKEFGPGGRPWRLPLDPPMDVLHGRTLWYNVWITLCVFSWIKLSLWEMGISAPPPEKFLICHWIEQDQFYTLIVEPGALFVIPTRGRGRSRIRTGEEQRSGRELPIPYFAKFIHKSQEILIHRKMHVMQGVTPCVMIIKYLHFRRCYTMVIYNNPF